MKITPLTVIAFAVMISGAIIFTIGMDLYFETHETETRLADIARAGSSVPTISYEYLWSYFVTSATFFAISGGLFAWKRK